MDKRYLSDGAIDILTLLSFVIGMQNLDLNITQNDLQEETEKLDRKVDEKVNKALSEIHSHLEIQDKKIDFIIERLKNENN